MMRSILIAAVLLSAQAANAERVTTNIQKVIEAARTLEWPEEPLDQRAYLLVKTQSMRSPVALVFGYADNAQACDELATDLSRAANARAASPIADLYVCDAIY